MVITLIGYRGSGKTAVAGPLAARLGWECKDADAEIEQMSGKTIREIFQTDGETHFRQLERRVMAELLNRERIVIAAGGGAVLDAQMRRLMKESGPVVWLQAPIARLEERMAGDAATAERRPPLTISGGRSEVEQLLALREPLYRECASLTVCTDDRSIEQVVEEVYASLPVMPGGGSPS